MGNNPAGIIFWKNLIFSSFGKKYFRTFWHPVAILLDRVFLLHKQYFMVSMSFFSLLKCNFYFDYIFTYFLDFPKPVPSWHQCLNRIAVSTVASHATELGSIPSWGNGGRARRGGRREGAQTQFFAGEGGTGARRTKGGG